MRAYLPLWLAIIYTLTLGSAPPSLNISTLLKRLTIAIQRWWNWSLLLLLSLGLAMPPFALAVRLWVSSVSTRSSSPVLLLQRMSIRLWVETILRQIWQQAMLAKELLAPLVLSRKTFPITGQPFYTSRLEMGRTNVYHCTPMPTSQPVPKVEWSVYLFF